MIVVVRVVGTVSVMCAMMIVRRLEVCAAFTEENEPDLAAHIEGREHGGKESENGNKIVDAAAFSSCKADGTSKNGIFTHEAAGERKTGKSKRSESKGCKGPWHVFAKTAHPAHVLLVVHGMDDGS